MSYWVLWLIIVILLVLMEAATVNLVSIWFIFSGIVSLFVSLFVDSFPVQFAIFVGLGVLLMILTKPMLDKMVKEKQEKTNLERIVGMEGVVTIPIKKNTVGEVKVDGKLWSAISSKSIKEGEIVKVDHIESVKLVVEPVIVEKPKTTTPKKKNTTSKKKTTNVKKKTTTKKTQTQKKESEK